MKFYLKAGPYLVNLGWRDPVKYKRHGAKSWALFFGIGSIARWEGMSGFSIGRVR